MKVRVDKLLTENSLYVSEKPKLTTMMLLFHLAKILFVELNNEYGMAGQ